MDKLSNDELWDRVRMLKGEVILSVVQKKRSRVLEVRDDRVITMSADTPGTHPKSTSRSQITRVYEHLFEQGSAGIVQGDLNALLGKPETRPFNGRLTLAILVAAASDQVEPFNSNGYGGIRLN